MELSKDEKYAISEHSFQGFMNTLKWIEYLGVYFSFHPDKEFLKEWTFMYSDPNFHMPWNSYEMVLYKKARGWD